MRTQTSTDPILLNDVIHLTNLAEREGVVSEICCDITVVQ